MNGRIRVYLADNLVVTGVLLALLYWLAESGIHASVFKEGGYMNAMFPSDKNELWMRLVIAFNFIGFSIYARAVVVRRRRAEDALRERVDELERFRKVMVERELRMKELKDRVFELESKISGDGGMEKPANRRLNPKDGLTP